MLLQSCSLNRWTEILTVCMWSSEEWQHEKSTSQHYPDTFSHGKHWVPHHIVLKRFFLSSPHLLPPHISRAQTPTTVPIKWACLGCRSLLAPDYYSSVELHPQARATVTQKLHCAHPNYTLLLHDYAYLSRPPPCWALVVCCHPALRSVYAICDEEMGFFENWYGEMTQDKIVELSVFNVPPLF